MNLSDKSLLIVFTYARAGFGHLRVTDALYHGLTNKDSSIIFDVPENVVTFMHRLTSIHPIMRKIFVWMQKGLSEEIFTHVYRAVLRQRTGPLYKRISEMIKQRQDRIQTLLIISTHFALAHQFGKIKSRLEAEAGLRLILAVQVTDDSPQKLWYVPEADIISTPSNYTSQTLLDYGKRHGYSQPHFETIPYPISPALTIEISAERYGNRVDQLNPQSRSQIEVMIPVSGAAVGLEFSLQLSQLLSAVNTRFKFNVLVKKTLYTEMFVQKMTELPYVNVHIFAEDRQMVDHYEEIYQQQTISLEITKPSEQAFKALLSPSQVGGPILLFTRPVGRQEDDNLEFLRRNKLTPSREETSKLWQSAKENKKPEIDVSGWRGIQLPEEPHVANVFINWLMNQHILETMVKAPSKGNLASNGVAKFWQKIAELLSSL